MQNEPILVIGSKPNSKLPNIKFSKIYTANGAAERSLKYKRRLNKIELICLTSKLNFEKNRDVRARIIKSKPDRLVVRFGKVALPKSLQKACKSEFINNDVQWKFQKKFFKFKGLSMIIGELMYKEKLYLKIKRVIKSLKNRNFQGISTGFYAILLALIENPRSHIIVSGIGLSGGSHFYKSKKLGAFNYDGRSAVDRFLIKFLYAKFKKKIFSVDEDFIKFSKTKLWKTK